jgi:hypothetical protein
LRTLPSEDQIRPSCLLVRTWICLADDLAQYAQPFLFEAVVVGVEVDCFAIGEADSEALLDVGVGLVLLGES